MRSILLCIDCSSYAKICAKYTIDLARLMEAYVDILYVSDLKNFELSVIADFGGSLGIQPFKEMADTMQKLENKKSQYLEKKFTRMFNSAHYTGKFKFNHRAGVIVDVFDEFKRNATGLDLVVLGKRGENSDYAKGHLGSTLERILRTSTCPCLIVPEKFRQLKKILIAYDGSDSVHRAIHFVERNRFFKECEIHIITINQSNEILQSLDEIKHILQDIAQLNVTTAESTGNVIDVINKYVHDHNIDLLITGAYSHSAIKHFFVGSTTLEIIRQSSIPTVVFR